MLLLLLGTAAAASGASGATAAAAPLLPANLSIDYWAPADRVAAKLAWVDPHAARGVRFSWQLVGGARGVAQAAYQVQVNAGERAVWDSGAVQSNQTLHVEYSGEQPLAADARYRWRVQVTDTRGGKSGFSPWQLLATALDSAEWEASGSSWINGDGRNQLRTEFPVPAEVHAAMAHASLFYSPVGYGLAWLNGVSVAPEAALGPWTTWSQRILYRCSDVTASLRPGANAIGVWLGKGQYDSTWTHAWFNAKEHGSSPPLGLRLVLRVTLKNGTALTVSTSSPQAWQASPSPFVSDDVYKGVEFDARNLTDGFALPHCDGCSGWSPAVAVPNASSFFGSLSPHVYTPTRIIAERHPVKMTRSPTGSYVYWFAENSVGWSTLNNVTLPAGTTLTLAHGEQLGLYEDGKLKQACLVGCENGSVWYAWGGAIDSYTLRGEGKPESYGALFSYHGFQFVELTGWPVGAAPPTLATVSAQVVHADNNRISQLAFPTEGKADLLNKLQENIVRSLLSNMHSVESDCPTRERVGWTGDSQATAETAAMALDMRSFWSKWLQDYEDAQCPGKPGCAKQGNDDGALSSTIPFAKHQPPVDPSWPTSYCQETMLIFKYYGDMSVMRDRFDSIRRYVDYLPTPVTCSNCKAPTNTITHAPNEPELPWYYMNGDWMEYEDQTKELQESGPLLSSYHYILDVQLLGEMAEILGNESLAKHYSSMAVDQLWPAFNRVYLKRQPPPAPLTASGTCGESPELKKGGHDIKLACPAGSVIDKVLFAALGTPSGSCAAGFSKNSSCDAPGVMAAVQSLCLGKASCALSVVVGKDSKVGAKTDPCVGVIKSMAVKVACNGTAPPPSPPRPTPAPLFGYATPGEAAGQLEQVVMLGRNGAPVPEEHRSDVEQTLLREIKAADNHITTGFIGNKYAWPALTDIGRAELALELALETTAPSYGFQIVNGATTLWENWSGNIVDAVAPEVGQGPSHNHHFLGGIGQWLQSDLVGLAQGAGIAYSHPRIAPAIVNHTDLPHAHGVFQTMRGELRVGWAFDQASRRVDINVTLPPNVVGAVLMPCVTDTVEESGKAVWRAGAFVPGAVGVTDAHLSKSRGGAEMHAEFACSGGGQYSFSALCSTQAT